MDSNLLFFTGFEGCTSTTDLRQLFHHLEGYAGGSYTVRYSATEGYWGSKAMLCQDVSDAFASIYYKNLYQVYVGGHIKIRTYSSTIDVYIRTGGNIQVNLVQDELMRVYVSGQVFDISVPVIFGVYYHYEAFVDTVTGTLIIKINGVEEFNQSGFAMNSSEIYRIRWGRQIYDNLWVHKTKSLGMAICNYSVPVADGYYNAFSGEFTAHNDSETFYDKLASNDGDTTYIHSSVPDAKFSCEYAEIPQGFQAVGWAMQTKLKNTTGGGLLYNKDLLRYENVDYIQKAVPVPDVYSNRIPYRTHYSTAPDGTELTRDKLNVIEFGSTLVEDPS